MRLPVLGENSRELRALLSKQPTVSALISEDLEPVALPPRYVLTSEGTEIAQQLDAHAPARWLFVAGALPDRFLSQLAHATHRRGRELTVVVTDPTKVFLARHGLGWYRAQGIELRALETIALAALTVNPLAPESHSFDSAELRAMLGEAIPDVPIFDVLHGDYAGVSPADGTVTSA